MNRPGIIAVLILAISIGITLNRSNLIESAESQEEERTAEQVYKNIQVFRGLPSSHLIGAMNFMAGSLGVSCNHCHVPNQFGKDDKPAKQTAREHLRMMRVINEANFGGKTVVNCATCHRGGTAISSLNLVQDPASADKVIGSSEPLPTLDQILDKYLLAIGGRKKIETLRTVTMKGTREMRNGADPSSIEQVEIYRKVPNKLLMNFKTSNTSSSQAFDGASGWRSFNGRINAIGGADLLGAKRDADLYKDFYLKETYPKLVVVGKQKINGRDAYVVHAAFAETHPAKAMFGIEGEKLYFDTQTGLLIRRLMEYQTALGALPEATDYMSYRKVSGLMLPFTIRLSRPPLTVTQKFAEVKINQTVEDAMFQMPKIK